VPDGASSPASLFAHPATKVEAFSRASWVAHSQVHASTRKLAFMSHGEAWQAKISQLRSNDKSSDQNPDFVDHCGRPIRYDSRVAGIENGLLGALFLAVVAGATIVARGRRDVRCG
jgi:hypothetical protein